VRFVDHGEAGRRALGGHVYVLRAGRGPGGFDYHNPAGLGSAVYSTEAVTFIRPRPVMCKAWAAE